MTHVARTLRRNATPTEQVLWEALRGSQRGYKVRRQQPVGGLCVDLYIPCARLVVEVDGPVHETQRDADAARETILQGAGLHLIRFRGQEVLTGLPGVLQRIDAAVTVGRLAVGRPEGRTDDRHDDCCGKKGTPSRLAGEGGGG